MIFAVVLQLAAAPFVYRHSGISPTAVPEVALRCKSELCFLYYFHTYPFVRYRGLSRKIHPCSRLPRTLAPNSVGCCNNSCFIPVCISIHPSAHQSLRDISGWYIVRKYDQEAMAVKHPRRDEWIWRLEHPRLAESNSSRIIVHLVPSRCYHSSWPPRNERR